ncbi:hypothetical protein NDU88_001928 [Pleurodeles waltl]|uniref:Uncharacterized protein n=1 Tax=Pleurodeles waltl TaxID=8319 RepID=A0AAV7P8J5_PLEWA|nr:hypothetical protein NDU88_001928 [Pleurodeles waltl]
MADSGSPCTIITTDCFKQKFKDVWRMSDLFFPDIIAEGFDGTAIDIKDYVDTEIEFKGGLAHIKLYVTEKAVNVLGWRDQAKLGIILNPRACEPVLMIEESNEMDAIVLKLPQVFTDVLGKLKNYSHKIKLKSGARPVVQKLRNVPIGVRDELKTILAGMVKDDVIEEIEFSEWVSPIGENVLYSYVAFLSLELWGCLRDVVGTWNVGNIGMWEESVVAEGASWLAALHCF